MFANPVFFRAAFVLFCSGSAFLMGILFIRLLRKSITEDAEISTSAKPSLEAMPMHVYNTVIQQLKQQKHELQEQSQADQRRARTSEIFSQTVIQNVPTGVLVFGTKGLAQQSNPAAKQILGFASPAGMSVEDIFRWAAADENSPALADEVRAALQRGGAQRQIEADYTTPADEHRRLAVTIASIVAQDGSLLGVACMFEDCSELHELRQQSRARKAAAAGSAN